MFDRHAIVAAALGLAGSAALVHASLTWSPLGALRFGLVAICLAFVAEAVVVRAGWLVHRLRPQLMGVPLPVLAGWIAATYFAYRVAGLVVAPSAVPFVAATIATAADIGGDPIGVRAGLWEYPQSGLAGPRFAAVPWWNFAGWFLLTDAVAVVGPPT